MSEIATGTESMPDLQIIQRQQHESARSWVYRLLLHNIVHLLLPPGTPVVESELRTILGVSRTPIREAFMQLAQENFITILPQKGTYVSRIDMSEVLELRFIRRCVESETVQRAAGNITPEVRDSLYARLAEQEKAAEQHDFEGFISADDAMHHVIYCAAGKEGVWEFFRRTNLQHFRSRLLRLRAGRGLDNLIREHKEIISCLVANDAAGAAAGVQKHLSDSTWNAGSVQEQYPDFINPPSGV